MFAMFKKVLFVIFLNVSILCPVNADTSSSGSLNGDVKSYLFHYFMFLQWAYVGFESEKIKVGDPDLVKINPAIMHMLDVIGMVYAGLLDECCWRGEQTTYEDYFVVASTAEVLNMTPVINPDYPVGDSRRYFITPTTYAKLFR